MLSIQAIAKPATLLSFVLFLSFSQSKPHQIGKKAPPILGITTKGTKIDSTYFKNKVTLVTFFAIGCAPCLQEINALKKLKKQNGFQVLYIVAQTGFEMQQFNSNGLNRYSKVRKQAKAGKIEFEILPQCEEPKLGEPKPLIEPDCNQIGQKFGVSGFPCTFLIDKKGIIRQAWFGFGMDSTDNSQIKSWQREIDKLLHVNQKK